MDSNYRMTTIGISLVLYAIACASPAMLLVHGDTLEPPLGFNLLCMSPLGFLIGQYCGFANVLYVMTIGVFAAKLWRQAFIFGITSVIVGLTSLSLWWLGFPSNEGDVGPRTFLKYPLIGFYFWLGSMAVLSMASYMADREKQENQSATAAHNADSAPATGMDENKTN